MSRASRAIRALTVHLADRPVGVINRLAGDRHLFAFEPDYVDDPDRPTLSLSFKAQGGTLVTTPRSYTTRVSPFFSNLLPEGPLRTHLAARAGVKPERELFLLAALGGDLPGAVVVTPQDHDDPNRPPDRASVAAIDGAKPSDTVLRFSLAGVQLKFSAILEATGGLTIPADGMGGSWIVKLPSAHYPAVPENEFVMLELARAVGIEVPEIRLTAIDAISGLPHESAGLEGHALAVRRFDRRPDGSRIHMEDFAQVFGLFPDDKYRRRSAANIAAVLWAETDEESIREFVRRLAFTVLIGNGDMHLKNWSLLYPDGRRPKLSPAYDFVSTVVYIPNDQLSLGFGGRRSLSGISREQVRRFADTAGLPASLVWTGVREIAERTAEAWRTLGARDVLPAKLRARIEKQIETATAKTEE